MLEVVLESETGHSVFSVLSRSPVPRPYGWRSWGMWEDLWLHLEICVHRGACSHTYAFMAVCVKIMGSPSPSELQPNPN